MESGVAAPSDAAVARILDADGVPQGAGFRVGPREVMTCAHVITKLLGLPEDTREAPTAQVALDFPLAERGTRLAAEIGAWIPVRPDGSGDIAVLRLLTDPPARAPIARLVEHGATADLRVRTLGFPEDYDLGAWSVGWLRGVTGAGWLQYDTDPAAEHQVIPGFSGAPVWDVVEGGVVGMVVAADDRTDVRTAYLIATDDLRESWSGLAATALPACPFRALEAFEERDAHLFHGRLEPARRIAALLGHAPATHLVGPSGCGKSSLLNAGVMPLLHPRTDLQTAALRPGRLGRSPLEALALALLPLLEPGMAETARLAELPALAGLLREGRMADVVERVLAQSGKDRLLLVVDQFEEALIGTEPAELDALAAALAYSLHPGARLRVVTTLRADFLTLVLGHPGLAPLFAGDRLFTVGAMSDEELREAVVRPPAGTGVTYEPGLVDRILADVGTDPARLPLLQFTLTRLWERQRQGRIGHEAYEALGRVHDALVTHAEQIWTGALTESEQRDARALLVRLVHPGDAGTAPTRRTLARSELRPGQWRLAQRLMTTRLLVPGEEYRPEGGPAVETVELAHETLLTQWGRLRTYFEADREFRMWQEGLRRRIALWSADAHPARRLLRGQDLRDARRWRAGRPLELSPAEETYIAASDKGAKRRAVAAGALVTVMALLVGGGFWLFQDGVEKGASHTAAGVLLQQSRDADAKPSQDSEFTALLLAMRAYRTENNPQTRARLRELHAKYAFADVLVPNSSTQGLLSAGVIPVNPFITGAGGRVVAGRAPDGEVLVLRQEADGLRRMRPGRRSDLLAVTPDGTSVAMVGSMLSSLPTALPTALPSAPPTGTPTALPTGAPTAIPSAPLDMRGVPVELFDVQSGKVRQLERPAEGDPYPGKQIPLESPLDDLLPDLPDLTIPGMNSMPPSYTRLAFTPDSRQLLAQTGGGVWVGRLIVWDLSDGRIKKVMPGVPEQVDGMWLLPSGEELVTVTQARDSSVTVKVWDLRGAAPKGREVTRTRAQPTGMTMMDVNPAVTRMAVLVQSTDGPRVEHRLTVHELPSGKAVRQEQITQQEVAAGVAMAAEGDGALPYAHPMPLPKEPGPIVRIGGMWGVDLTGTVTEQAAVLTSLGLLAVAGPSGGDPVRRLLPAPPGGESPSGDTVGTAEADRALAHLCRILADETLPASVAGKLPHRAHPGAVCDEGKGRRG
ncbi:trypsin-like peptidase domain-containing protein [Streptomyces sp. NPDC048603]|uniref:nSTAND1 domain-containing NTPase n=1 Tax=Streptomyces sp. NPDC048603 TaxID=3365577 RepID=UPI0037243561